MDTYLNTALTSTRYRSLVAAALASLLSASVLADDTDVYLDQLTLPPEQTRPNVVFILDTSGKMGLPVAADNGTNSNRESNNYDENGSYFGAANNSGGVGDNDYYYLYAKPNTLADPYIYVNKVHKNQVALCNMSKVDVDSHNYESDAPFETSSDNYVYNTGATWTRSRGGSNNDRNRSKPMCREYEASCDFTSGPSGPLVDCKSEENRVSENNRYNSSRLDDDLYAVTAKYHNYLQEYYRYTVLLRAMKDLIDSNYDINLSMERFNGSDGGYLFKETLFANDETNANQIAMRYAIDNIYAFNDSATLTESLWEGYRHLAGLSADYGNNSGTDTPSAAYHSGNIYNSAIDYACQKSYLILLTAGSPSNDTGADENIERLSGGPNCSGNCLDEFAGWIHTNGASPRDHSALTGIQDITVHTIGFGAGADTTLLENTAAKGGGLYKEADSAESLLKAFQELIDSIEFESDTSVAPAVAVNTYSGLTHREEMYFALFKPANTPRWSGNIKKYTLRNKEIVDVTDTPAVDSTTGYFKASARSYWSTARDTNGDGDTNDDRDISATDGDDITIGGFATQLTTPTSRRMLTYTGTAPIYSDSTTPTPVMLTENLDAANTAINSDPSLLGATAASIGVANIIQWARGDTSNDSASARPAGFPQPNFFVADIIHTPPSVVTYTTNNRCAADPGTADLSTCFGDVLFAATNMGTFHAIDTNDGRELFSFVPKELLPNLTTYYENIGGSTAKVYGLDGPMSVWRYDDDKDGSIESEDFVYIYQSMRRGGSNIYAFDVTDIMGATASPKLMWQINGSALGTPDGDYRDLAQTWSTPQRTTLRWNCASSCQTKEVLIFGGGYDPVHDDATSPLSSSKGNAIYIVDATTSKLLWSAGNGRYHDFNHNKLTNSFAANVTPGDIDGDGYIDFLFAVDIQGKVWRFDVDQNASTAAASITRGGLIAELGGRGSHFRRFYNAPDIAYFTPQGKAPLLSISIASGHRANPREELIDDRLFVLFDYNLFSAPSSYNYVNGSSTIDPSDLLAAGSSTTTDYGWYLAYTGTGEKGLSQTKTFNGNILMTTFLPAAANTCEGSTGEGRYYALDALSGRSTLVNNNNTAGDISDDTMVNFETLLHGGIPPEPVIIFGQEPVCVADCDQDDPIYENQSRLTACIGTECLSEDINLSMNKTYWREN